MRDTRWQALVTAGTDRDRAREAHTLASTCRSFGLPASADMLRCIEAQAKGDLIAQPPPSIPETGDQLSRDLEALRAAINGL